LILVLQGSEKLFLGPACVFETGFVNRPTVVIVVFSSSFVRKWQLVFKLNMGKNDGKSLCEGLATDGRFTKLKKPYLICS
jgi:hypothetical protein